MRRISLDVTRTGGRRRGGGAGRKRVRGLDVLVNNAGFGFIGAIEEGGPDPAMITMYVTYAGDADTPFDREHWINVHFPLVRECWGPYGLERLAGFSLRETAAA